MKAWILAACIVALILIYRGLWWYVNREPRRD